MKTLIVVGGGVYLLSIQNELLKISIHSSLTTTVLLLLLIQFS